MPRQRIKVRPNVGISPSDKKRLLWDLLAMKQDVIDMLSAAGNFNRRWSEFEKRLAPYLDRKAKR